MSVRVRCPKCATGYTIPDAKVGAQGRCHACGELFALALAIDDTVSAEAPPLPPSTPTSETVMWDPSHQAHPNNKTTASSEVTLSFDPQSGDPIPKSISRYVIRRKLGKGAMGEVFLAFDPNLDREVAIKMLPPTLAGSATRLAQFVGEAKMAARLHHTNVATVYETGTQGNLAYIAMEFVKGIPLNVAIHRHGPMPWREATHVLRDAASGLNAAHGLGLVHRDVKPANLIRTHEGVTKVVDFGLAQLHRADQRQPQPGTLEGTPAYMSPEQWENRDVDARSDLYSLTLTYFFLLTGRAPFAADSLPELARLHWWAPLPDPRRWAPDLPDEVCRVLIRGAAKKPGLRFHAASELIGELEFLLACPNELLHFGSPWGTPAAAVSAAAPAVDLGTSATGAALPTLVARPPTRSRKSDSSELRPWLIGSGVVMLAVLLLSVLVAFIPTYGSVRIKLKRADEQVQVLIDDRPVTVDELAWPVKLRVGPHRVVVNSPVIETVSQEFRVWEDEVSEVDILCEPKTYPTPVDEGNPIPVKPEPAPPRPIPPADPRSATYTVQVEPPEAVLAVSGKGATSERQGPHYVVTVKELSGPVDIILVAHHTGYKPERLPLTVKPGESSALRMTLKPAAEPGG